MSAKGKDGKPACPPCDRFEPQAWRKSICRNCFHTIEDHTAVHSAETGTNGKENKPAWKSKSEKDSSKSEPLKVASQDKQTTSIRDKYEKLDRDKLKTPEKEPIPKSSSGRSSINDKLEKLGVKVMIPDKKEPKTPPPTLPKTKRLSPDMLHKDDKKPDQKQQWKSGKESQKPGPSATPEKDKSSTVKLLVGNIKFDKFADSTLKEEDKASKPGEKTGAFKNKLDVSHKSKFGSAENVNAQDSQQKLHSGLKLKFGSAENISLKDKKGHSAEMVSPKPNERKWDLKSKYEDKQSSKSSLEIGKLSSQTKDAKQEQNDKTVDMKLVKTSQDEQKGKQEERKDLKDQKKSENKDQKYQKIVEVKSDTKPAGESSEVRGAGKETIKVQSTTKLSDVSEKDLKSVDKDDHKNDKLAKVNHKDKEEEVKSSSAVKDIALSSKQRDKDSNQSVSVTSRSDEKKSREADSKSTHEQQDSVAKSQVEDKDKTDSLKSKGEQKEPKSNFRSKFEDSKDTMKSKQEEKEQGRKLPLNNKDRNDDSKSKSETKDVKTDIRTKFEERKGLKEVSVKDRGKEGSAKPETKDSKSDFKSKFEEKKDSKDSLKSKFESKERKSELKSKFEDKTGARDLLKSKPEQKESGWKSNKDDKGVGSNLKGKFEIKDQKSELKSKFEDRKDPKDLLKTRTDRKDTSLKSNFLDKDKGNTKSKFEAKEQKSELKSRFEEKDKKSDLKASVEKRDGKFDLKSKFEPKDSKPDWKSKLENNNKTPAKAKFEEVKKMDPKSRFESKDKPTELKSKFESKDKQTDLKSKFENKTKAPEGKSKFEPVEKKSELKSKFEQQDKKTELKSKFEDRGKATETKSKFEDKSQKTDIKFDQKNKTAKDTHKEVESKVIAENKTLKDDKQLRGERQKTDVAEVKVDAKETDKNGAVDKKSIVEAKTPDFHGHLDTPETPIEQIVKEQSPEVVVLASKGGRESSPSASKHFDNISSAAGTAASTDDMGGARALEVTRTGTQADARGGVTQPTVHVDTQVFTSSRNRTAGVEVADQSQKSRALSSDLSSATSSTDTSLADQLQGLQNGHQSTEPYDKVERLHDTDKGVVENDIDAEQIKLQLKQMEERCLNLEVENESLAKELVQHSMMEEARKRKKDEVGVAFKDLQQQLRTMEQHCGKLETDNKNLMGKLRSQQEAKADEPVSKEEEEIRDKLREREGFCEDLEEENETLKQEIQDLKVEMEEMYDSFRDQEAEEFRELQKELEITAKNCRILQFKMRKAERRNEQIEIDRNDFEDKLRLLQMQFDNKDAVAHIRSLEDELKMAKDVSVRLHDELDLMDDRRGKMEDENRHLTELLEQADRKQFRLEMEVDKLRDQVMDLRQELSTARSGRGGDNDSSAERKAQKSLERQGSQEVELQQIKRELYDGKEREADLKDQLKFVQEQTKAMRKKIVDLEEDNDNLSTQLKKMSVEQAVLAKNLKTGSKENGDVTVTQAEIELKVQFELAEQELSVLRKKIADIDEENEMLHCEIFYLEKEVKDKEKQLLVKPEPSSPNAYYEDKIKHYEKEADEFRSKLLEKEKDIEQLYAQMKSIETRKGAGNLRKSKSLDLESDYCQVVDLKRQVELTQQESLDLREKLEKVEDENCQLRSENDRLKSEAVVTPPSPSLTALAVAYVDTDENSELLKKISELERQRISLTESIIALAEKVVSLTTAHGNGEESRLNSQIPDNAETGKSCDSPRGESHDFSKTYYFTRSPSSQKLISCDTASNQSLLIDEVEVGSRDPASLLAVIEESVSVLARQTAGMDAEISRAPETMETGEGGTSPETPAVPTESPEPEQMSSATDSDMSSAKDSENKEVLLDRILDLEEEIDDLRLIVKSKEEKNIEMEGEISELNERLVSIQNDSRRKELELLQDLDMLHDKNEIISNLLDIMKDRAESAEEELERVITEINEADDSSSVSSDRSASAVSALSGVSVGSDEVFDGSPSEKSQVVHREWEDQFRKRISCLERLLAEERGRVAAAEKKLQIAGSESLSSAMSDDVKLHIREKDLLQSELRESQKHVRLASDQIRGLTDKLKRVESERWRSPKLLRKKQNAFLGDDLPQTPNKDVNKQKEVCPDCLQLKQVKEECQKYKEKADDLEIKVDEVNEIWVSKSAASEKEKETMEEKLRQKLADCKRLEETLTKMKEEIRRKDAVLKDKDTNAKEKVNVISRKDEMIQEQEEIIRQREEDLQSLLDLISSREKSIRELQESIRARDERLREKDDMIQKLNNTLEEKSDEIHLMEDEIQELTSKRKESETLILQMQDIITESKKAEKSDVENENERLQSDIDNLMGNITDLHGDKTTLQTELDKSKHALSEAMLMWDRDRSTLGCDLNIAREKVRMYKETAGKKDSAIIGQLRAEVHEILERKEKLANELRLNKMEYENTVRILKLEKFKLTEELTSKIRMLTNEITKNDKMSDELARLRIQDDRTDQLRHQEKMLKAEYMAMQVRYETQLERLQKEHLTLLSLADRLQREKNLDQEIIVGIQKSMHNIRATYTNDLSRWTDERKVLEKHITAIEEGKELAYHLRSQVEDLKRQLLEQEVERTELVNRMTTERKSWDIEKATFTSRINQLEEKLALHVQAQSKSMDLQCRMEVTWEKERAEQKRLLAEAHSLALDLQEQLQKRDQEHARERKNLLDQLERERQNFKAAKSNNEKKSLEVQTGETRVKYMDKMIEELKEKHQQEADFWGREKADILRRLAELRKVHNKDSRRIEDVLTGLKRLRELAAIVVDAETSESSPSDGTTDAGAVGDASAASASTDVGEVGISDLKQNLDQVILKYVKESLRQIHFAAEDLARPAAEKSREEKQKLRRSLSSSEIELLKEEFLVGSPESGIILSHHETIPEVKSHGVERERVRINRRITHDGSGIPSEVIQPEFIDTILVEQSSYSTDNKGADTIERHTIRMIKDCQRTETSIAKLPHPPPSFIIPKSKSRSTSPVPHSIPIVDLSRPKMQKSMSVDTANRMSAPPGGLSSRTYSHDSSPSSTENFTLSSVPNGHAQELQLPGAGLIQTGSLDRLSPHTARRRFFENQSDSSVGYMSWPERKRNAVHEDLHTRSLSTSSEIPESLESETDQPHRGLRQSVSMDESSVNGVHTVSDDSDNRGRSKEKKNRRGMKKSQSVDSSSGRNSLKDIFAAMKRKLKPRGLKRSHSAREPKSPDSVPEVVDESDEMNIHEKFTPIHIPEAESAAETRSSRRDAETTRDKSHGSNKNTSKDSDKAKAHKKKKRFRSKSADRVVSLKPTHPILIGTSQTSVDAALYFSETCV